MAPYIPKARELHPHSAFLSKCLTIWQRRPDKFQPRIGSVDLVETASTCLDKSQETHTASKFKKPLQLRDTNTLFQDAWPRCVPSLRANLTGDDCCQKSIKESNCTATSFNHSRNPMAEVEDPKSVRFITLAL